MVRFSTKQIILNSISGAAQLSMEDKAKMQEVELQQMLDRQADSTNAIDSDSTASDVSDIDSGDLSDDNSNHSNSDFSSDGSSATGELFRLYSMISEQRYIAQKISTPGRMEKLIDILERWAEMNDARFRGMVRMTPEAFEKLAIKLQRTSAFGAGKMAINKVREILSVALYRLGRSGNAAGERDASLQCGCSVGSLVAYTERTVEGLLELNNEVMAFASEAERQEAQAWVPRKSGVEEWGKGWMVVDGTHIPLAWKPAIMGKEHYNYKGFHSLNVALVILPHSLRIVESVVGQPGSVQDSKVWTSGSNILKKPRRYLDEDEFIWVDGGYGHSPFTVGPFAHIAADKSCDLRHFNNSLSRVRVRVEHAIAYLKNRFHCLKGYRGNIYRTKDRDMAAKTIQACIVAHTFASRYDGAEELAELLQGNSGEEMADEELQYIMQWLRISTDQARDKNEERRANQAQYEADTAALAARTSQWAISQMRISQAHDLRERVFQALFQSTGRSEEDTNAQSRRHERTIEDHERRESQSRGLRGSQQDAAASSSSRSQLQTTQSLATQTTQPQTAQL